MAMDVKRDPAILRRKKIRRVIFGVIGLIAVIGVSAWVSRLRPAAPMVDSPPWFDTVKRGPFVRQVRGSGTLVPEDNRVIPATTSGRVERILLRPGAVVTPDSVILELSNPDLLQAVHAAELAWESSKAQLANQTANLNSNLLSQQAAVQNNESDHKQAQVVLEANEALGKQGLMADVDLKRYRGDVDRAKTRLDLSKKQLDISTGMLNSQLSPLEADVKVRRADFDLKQRQLEDLKVRAGMHGVLQLVPPERGQQIGPGTVMARVANPDVLKAQLRISETQTKDLLIGQLAEIDTRNGPPVKGHVSRIDPSAVGGTVGVDVTLDGPLPPGSRPDLSVDGVVELERLENVVFVGRPSFGSENATVGLFKVTADGREAVHVTVQLGKSAVNTIEVKSGLQPGDVVILSDMSTYDQYPRVRIK